MHIDFFETEEPSEIERAFAAMYQADAEALLVLEHWKFHAQRHQIMALTAQQRLQALCEDRRMAAVDVTPNLRSTARATARDQPSHPLH